MYYALCRCLAEKRPVIWRYRGELYMFVEEGVYWMSTDFRRAWYHTDVWTLIDSDVSQGGIPTEFAERDLPFFIIYVTSPTRSRWSRMSKAFRLRVIVMNPWTRSEIYHA